MGTKREGEGATLGTIHSRKHPHLGHTGHHKLTTEPEIRGHQRRLLRLVPAPVFDFHRIARLQLVREVDQLHARA
jgi:hypothetical protein